MLNETGVSYMDIKLITRCHVVAGLIIITMICDWSLIFYSVQQESIISHWALVIPVLGTFFFILSLFARLGLYAQNVWGFLTGMFVILFTWVTYYYFYTSGGKELLTQHGWYTLYALIVLNAILFFYIIFLYAKMRK
jgi:hypothetical protein